MPIQTRILAIVPAKDDPTIYVQREGRVTAIEISAEDAEDINWLRQDDPTSPVKLTFRGPNGYYINVFDHRKIIREATEPAGDGDWEPFYKVFQKSVPCLAGFRLKRESQYIVITNLGTADVADGGEQERLILTRQGEFDHSTHKIPGKGRMIPLHLDTGICLIVPR